MGWLTKWLRGKFYERTWLGLPVGNSNLRGRCGCLFCTYALGGIGAVDNRSLASPCGLLGNRSVVGEPRWWKVSMKSHGGVPDRSPPTRVGDSLVWDLRFLSHCLSLL